MSNERSKNDLNAFAEASLHALTVLYGVNQVDVWARIGAAKHEARIARLAIAREDKKLNSFIGALEHTSNNSLNRLKGFVDKLELLSPKK